MGRTILSVMLAIGCSTTDDSSRVEHAPSVQEPVAEPTAGSEPIAEPEPPAPPEPATDENDPRWHDAFTRVARGYAMWGRVDDELRFAPGLCRMQMPGRARFTASDDEGSHGGAKLYSVFALDPVAYGMPPTEGGPYTLASTRSILTGSPSSVPVEDGAVLAAFTHSNVQQVLVKESFRPQERTFAPGEVWPAGPRRLMPAPRDGHTYFAGEPLGLYVMMRMRDADTPGTDAGWVYGTVTPDGTITASGRVRSCMSCHVDAPHDRWFGLPGRAENG